MVTDIEFLKEELKQKVTEKRYMHSWGVMKMCKKLAKIYSGDIERAKLIGLMHDLAKDMLDEDKLSYIMENNINCTDVEKRLVDILHGKIAADICKKKYQFDDEMCMAISAHTTGKENMTLLQKILFVADKTDETRKYASAEELRNIAYVDLDKAIIKNIDDTLSMIIQNNRLITEDSIKTRNYLLF